MKFILPDGFYIDLVSPSVWREWIEIVPLLCMLPCFFVSLRVEGVD